MNRIARFFRVLGPGLITGAADDDPSGISTYSVAGASAGYSMLIRLHHHRIYRSSALASRSAALRHS
jgi:hypothetical protein